MSLNLHYKSDREYPKDVEMFDALSSAANAVLLITDDKLVQDIEAFIIKIHKINKDDTYEDISKIKALRHDLIKRLRENLLS